MQTALRVLTLTLLVLTASGCAALFPKKAGSSLAHFTIEAPAPGEPAPDVEVWTLQGESVRLSDRMGKRPVVLQLGSYTCPVFRYRRFWMQTLIEKYRNQVDFLVVYTQEAHPVGSASPYRDREWVPWINKLTRVRTPQAESLKARLDQSASTKIAFDPSVEFLADGMNNEAWRSYGRAPAAAFLIDRHGRIHLRQPWVDPEDLSRAIDRLLSKSP